MKTDSPSSPLTIWLALNEWAKKLKPWQRNILALAIQHGQLTDLQIEDAYNHFLEEHELASKTERTQLAIDVTGRPSDPLNEKLRLDLIDEVIGVNALPVGAKLSFSPGLTIIYGRNGAGKSGFARILANACFSRHKPKILCNIYDGPLEVEPTARLSFSLNDNPQQSLSLYAAAASNDLKRISLFDTAVARFHLSQSTPFEFKPSGFDVFPEMARVFSFLAGRLDNDIKLKENNTNFSDSFIGNDTVVSKAVSAIQVSDDLQDIRKLAIYGPTEVARLAEIDRQLIALRSKSPQEALKRLKEAKQDVTVLRGKLLHALTRFTLELAASRSTISLNAKKASDAATLLGSEQFKRPFFKAIGSREWQDFAEACLSLAKKEDESYPTAEARCLLCEQPLDRAALKHVQALLAYVEGDAQKEAKAAEQVRTDELAKIARLDLNIFSSDSRVRGHINRLNPSCETRVAELIVALNKVKEETLASLNIGNEVKSAVDGTEAIKSLTCLIAQIDDDITKLENTKVDESITVLDIERQTLRHREVIKNLLPQIEDYVKDRVWRKVAQNARTALNSRLVTEKEKELFAKVVGETYKNKFDAECDALKCQLPVVSQTAGQKGKTVKSLQMKGGYQPEQILSEGEQRAIALADFLTEIALNPSSAGIILDDPVNSQDHERKELIAKRLIKEASERQVIVFTHDLVFLTNLLNLATAEAVEHQAHWIDRNNQGSPGFVALNDAPAVTKVYDTTEQAKKYQAKATTLSGSEKSSAIAAGMGALRRTIEETIAKKFLKNVVPRWSDRVIVTGLRNVAWDDNLVEELCSTYEKLSGYIEGHSHTDEAIGAPPELKDLDHMISSVDALISRAKPERKKK